MSDTDDGRTVTEAERRVLDIARAVKLGYSSGNERYPFISDGAFELAVAVHALQRATERAEHRRCKKAPGPPNVSPEPGVSPRRASEASEPSGEAEGKP